MLRCPYCGSTRIVRDERRGYLVCADCGAVIKEILEDDVNDKIILDINVRQAREIVNKSKMYKLLSTEKIRSIEVRDSSASTERYARIRAMNLLLNMAPRDLILNVVMRRALVNYIIARAQGYPHRTALKKTSSIEGIPIRSLERTVKKYRPLLWYIALRVADESRKKEEREHLGSSKYSQKDTRTYL